ncbi:hypothetical protein BGX33_001787, partial [Mortierella sp. NVP41]
LDLGALGIIEIKGIPLDVKTTMAGLQGLSKIDYVSQISMFTPQGWINISTIVNIHNPSQLTLKIGDMRMEVGLNYTKEGWGGLSVINDLTLVPGDNQVVSNVAFFVSGIPGGLDVGQIIADMISTQDTRIFLYALPGATSNPALDAGLGSLRTSVVIPATIPPNLSAYPYGDTWSVKVLPTTINDGLVEVTTTFMNPFSRQTMHFLSPNSDPTKNNNAAIPYSYILTPDGGGIGSGTKIFGFSDDLTYTLKPNETVTMTFKMRIPAELDEATQYKRKVTELIQSAADGKLEMEVMLTPTITLGNDPTLQYPLLDQYGSGYTTPLTLLTGPDFPQIMDYYDKYFAPKNVVEPPSSTVPIPSPTATTTVEPTAVPTSTVSPVLTSTVSPVPTTTTTAAPEIPSTPSPSPSLSPTPSPSPVVEPSPIAPAA